MKKIILITAISILALAGVSYAQPALVSYPLALESVSNTVTVTWTDANQCEMRYGTSPLNYTSAPIPQSSNGTLSFFPENIPGMTGGVYYCVIDETGNTPIVSAQFQLYVESTTAPNMIQPGSLAGTQYSSLPPFMWGAVSGVPAYTLMLSDEPIQIQVPSSGSGSNITITSDPIWLVTTNQQNITYPTADPSGYYNLMQPPPLIPGLTYSWVVLNNYTGTPSMISDAFAGTFQFSITGTAACTAPNLETPVDGNTINAVATIDLVWDTVPNANSYMVFLTSDETNSQEVGGLSRVPRWNTIVSGSCNNVTIPADVGLNDRWYSWYVIAEDSTGMGAKSQTNSFYYNITTTGVDIQVSSIAAIPNSGAQIPEAVVFMHTMSGGNVNIYPIITDNSGNLTYDLPPDTYSFYVQRQGYDSTTVTVAVPSMSGTFNIPVWLTPSADTITGIVEDNSSPSQPVQGALITATQSGITYQTYSLSDGSFVLYVSAGGTWTMQASKQGYASAPASATISGPANTAAASPSPIILKKNLNTLSGTVTNPSGKGIYDAVVSIYLSGNPADSYQLNTDTNGNYTFSLPDGTWIVSVAKTGFVSPPSSDITLAGGSTGTLNFTMQLAADQINGKVTDSSSNPLSGVVVSATSVSGTVNTTTDAYGNYTLSVANGFVYALNAYESGYTETSSQNVDTTTYTSGGQQINGVNFTMNTSGVLNNSSLYVQVTGTGAPNGLAGVSINISGPGYPPANAVTDSYGGATFTAMPTGVFAISLTEAGYLSIATGVTITSGANTADFGMLIDPTAPGTISGTVLNGTNPIAGVMIIIYPQGSTFTSVPVTYTAANGTYSVPGIIEGNYIVQPVIDNYVISPAQAYVSLSPGGTATANFTLTSTQGGKVSVTAPSSIIFNENIGGPYVFNANYTDGSGAPVSVNFSWSVVPSSAGTIVGTGSSVTFVPTTNYIGQATIAASALGQANNTTVPVWQKLTASPVWPVTITGTAVQDYNGFSLFLPYGCASANNTVGMITLTKEQASSERAMTKDGMVAGSIYDLTNGFAFSMPATITLPVPSNYSASSAQIGAWDSTNLKWDFVSGSSMSGGNVSGSISNLAEFAVIIPLKPLGFENVTILPNPFSPLRGGMNITYVLDSDESSQVITTIAVYNVAGKLIKTLVDRQEKGTGVINTQVWDGKDKDGKWAVNGRYILQIEIKDASGTKQGLYSIAVIK